MTRATRQLALSLCPLLLFGHAVQAFADTCPEVSTIVQQASADGGFAYSAPNEGSLQWEGEKIYRDKQALDKLKFESVMLNPDENAVICEYKEGKNSLLLELKSKAPVSKEGADWGDDEKAPFCESDIQACTFSLTPVP